MLPNNDAIARLLKYVSDGGEFEQDTTANQFAEVLELSHSASVKLAQSLGRAGFGLFKIGRRNHPTRLMWNPGQPEAGAIRKAIDWLNGASLEEVVVASMARRESESEPVSELTLTISQAKEALARSLGLASDNIEIIIRA